MRIAMLCQKCGKGFSIPKSHLPDFRVWYCSEECSGGKVATRPCIYCGVTIIRAPFRFKGDVFYCGSVCRNKHVAMKDRPEARIEGDLVFIPLSQDRWAKVDRADYESIPTLKEMWCASWYESSHTFYALRRENKVGIYMHREITGAPDGMDVNHRNHDGLENTRENLEVCTRQENIRYKRKQRTVNGQQPTSRYKGVSWIPIRQKWRSELGHKEIGVFDSEEDAAEAYNRAATLQYGRFALLNEIELDE